MTSNYRLRLGSIAAASVAFGTLILAQGAARQAPATLDDLLAELRGLRADMAQSANATIKTQLLVARLQVEEQRINGIAKQIVDVQAQLAPVRESLAKLESDSKRFEDIVKGRTTPDGLSDSEKAPFLAAVAQQFQGIQASLESQRNRERELAAQGDALSNQFASEQARWTDFNDRLDQLERSLPAR
jgi:hypothetical protein